MKVFEVIEDWGHYADEKHSRGLFVSRRRARQETEILAEQARIEGWLQGVQFTITEHDVNEEA